eukprot:TRINITY_DN2664_c0_g1_i16.p1 TRINITY_DN2664_c0_g1~~TRINITY_DN2664_c0_g1_i16.p1  ORF type:complete len:147 (-),score=19.52 TRINITY_DN2664_c0_g1_i16:127-567(-)
MVESSAYTLDKKVLDEELAKQTEWHRVLLLNHEGKPITSRNLASEPSSEEIALFLHCLEDRDKAVGPGFNLCGDHFDVLRFHPPLVYGRRGPPNEGEGEGIAYCRVKSQVNNKHLHLVVTYILPIISARVVPQMLEFAKKFLGEPT